MAFIKDKNVLFSYAELEKWGRDVLALTEMDEEEKKNLLEMTLLANLRGVDTHGITMLPFYAERYKQIEHRAITSEKDFGAGVLIDGGNHTGHHVSVIGMEEAIKKADQFGIGMAIMKESNHSGAMGNYALRAAQRGYVGFVTTNTMPLMAPWGGLKLLLGNDPISISFPYQEMPIVLDIACTVAARQKVYNYQREGKLLPDGWATDKEGNPTNDPAEALEGMLLGIGGYKGAGIAAMIDMILGVFAGGVFGTASCPNVVQDRPQHTTHLMVMVKPDFYVEKAVQERSISEYVEMYKNVPAKQGSKIYLPGEIEWMTQKDRESNGIPITIERFREMCAYTEKNAIPPLTLES